MKKLSLLLALALCVSLTACGKTESEVIQSTPAETEATVPATSLETDSENTLSVQPLLDQWERVTVSGSECYALKNIPYCLNPADPAVQFVDIYVPAAYVDAADNGNGFFTCAINKEGTVTNANGTLYTAITAPVVLQNSIDAYKQSDPIDIADDRRGGGVGTYFDFVDSGYVLVSVACRGVTSEVDGTAPAAILDLKAAVRMLKANDDLLPGDMNKIIATGGSAGGGCASLLGASGNSGLYTDLLTEMGADMASSDDIFAVAAYCPITNLDTADGAFEWLHITETQLAPVNHGDSGGRNDGITHNDAADAVDLDELGLALQQILYSQFLQDLEEYGIDPDEFYDGFLGEINECIADYIAENVDDLDSFAQANPYLSYDGTSVAAADVASFVSNSMHRSKSVPAFDVLTSGSNENKLFDQEHFSTEVMAALEQLADEIPRAAVYLEKYQLQITEERLMELKLMTPNVFLSGEEDSTVASHWRFRIGTNDGDLGASTAWLMTNLLQKNPEVQDVDYALVWGKPHGTADYSFDNIRDYIDLICS
jgi:hypothetical protein